MTAEEMSQIFDMHAIKNVDVQFLGLDVWEL